MKTKGYQRLVSWVCLITVTSSSCAAATPASTLDDKVPHIELTSGAATIGGASIEDAVIALRQLTKYPINLELVEFDQEKNGLTLGRALDQLHALKDKSNLSSADQARLEVYEDLATQKSRSTLIGFEERTFTLIQDGWTVRELLDRITQLDDNYDWRNDGTDQQPIVVIQPHMKSSLDWSVPSICKSGRRSLTRDLYGAGGDLAHIFGVHFITQMIMSDGNRLPDVEIDLCTNNLTARDVLDLTIEAAGPNYSWTLAGIKGMRWVTFQRK